MKREHKVELAQRLAERLQQAKIVVAVDYKGLTVAEMEDIRNAVKEQGFTFNVIKNNIVKKAVEGTNWEVLTSQLKGPNAFALSFDDVAALAKVLVTKTREFKNLQIKFGCIEGKLLSAKDIDNLSKLPPKDVLMAQLLGTMKAPVSGFVNVLAANIRQLLYALKAIEIKRKEEV